MQKINIKSSRLFVIMVLIGFYITVLPTAFVMASSSPQGQSSELSDDLGDSALAELAQALQKDAREGNLDGGDNWDTAISDLEDKLEFSIDEDFEDALKNITIVHMNDISGN